MDFLRKRKTPETKTFTSANDLPEGIKQTIRDMMVALLVESNNFAIPYKMTEEDFASMVDNRLEKDEESIFHVRTVGEDVVGLVIVSETDAYDTKILHVSDVYVNPKWRGKKHGRALMEHVLSIYKYDRVDLTVISGNKAAQKMYKKLGFEEASINLSLVK